MFLPQAFLAYSLKRNVTGNALANQELGRPLILHHSVIPAQPIRNYRVAPTGEWVDLASQSQVPMRQSEIKGF